MWRKADSAVVFDVHVTVHACSNIPHSHGRVFGVWKFTGRRGLSSMERVGKDHNVVWAPPWCISLPSIEFPLTNQVMASQSVRFSIRQEKNNSTNGYTRLGVVVVDLAEYVGGEETSRRFLLDKSRVNCTLHMTIASTQRQGDVLFKRRESNQAPLVSSQCSLWSHDEIWRSSRTFSDETVVEETTTTT
ncbi:hypothetical protein LEN26_015274 [Aphanomyces euteiches]|nr:hypothetical protein LEN26_015274 [Aphanomyces euteiches]KAH9116203.1 hypothetical protein AeMF1_009840 [Aphanomyces euteiches]KAH9194451.1 hypothetical protein AeNC1_003565 [Aphanomyces euteiches]